MFRRDREALSRDQQMAQTMQVTVACALELDTRAVARGDAPASVIAASRRVVCWRDDNHQSSGPFEPLFAAMDRAEVTVCYNGVGFDMPILRKYYDSSAVGRHRYLAHQSKLHDPFSRLRDALGEWPKLNTLLCLNGIDSKLSCGAGAVEMWEAGRRDELQAYCMYDVEALTMLVLLENGLRVPAAVALKSVGSTVQLPARITALRYCISQRCNARRQHEALECRAAELEVSQHEMIKELGQQQQQIVTLCAQIDERLRELAQLNLNAACYRAESPPRTSVIANAWILSEIPTRRRFDAAGESTSFESQARLWRQLLRRHVFGR